jgi:hypothetical protein
MERRAMMKHENGNWQVVRDCCTSGNCLTCHGATTGKGSVRVTQGTAYSEAYAKFVAGNWSSYKAVAQEMQVGRGSDEPISRITEGGTLDMCAAIESARPHDPETSARPGTMHPQSHYFSDSTLRDGNNRFEQKGLERELLAALKEAVTSCACSIRERDAGHREACQVPQWLEIIKRAERA